MPRQPLIKVFLLCVCSFFNNHIAAAQPQVLSVICPASLIDSKTLADFERKTKVQLRIEITASPHEFEQRLKNSANNWDVVIADENELTLLNAARLIRPLNDPRFAETKQLPLAQPSKTQTESHAYVGLMADPFGIVWLDDTLGTKRSPSWDAFVNPAENPLWRGRIFLPSDLTLLARTALMAHGMTNAQTSLENGAQALDWLRKAHMQTRQGSSQLVLELLKKRVVAGALWKSDYLRVRHTVPSLNFSPPQNTFFRRFGAALVADTLHEEMALNFIAHLVTHRNDLARFAGIVPLEFTADKDADISKWVLYDETLPINPAFAKEMSKIFGKTK